MNRSAAWRTFTSFCGPVSGIHAINGAKGKWLIFGNSIWILQMAGQTMSALNGHIWAKDYNGVLSLTVAGSLCDLPSNIALKEPPFRAGVVAAVKWNDPLVNLLQLSTELINTIIRI